MPRSVTLRLSDDVYQKFSQIAREENRSMANLVETLALQKLTEEIFTDRQNIKKLKNYHPETWRYRIGRYRFFYEIDDPGGIVFMIAADDRKDSY